MNMLVTGGAGFIGSHLAERLLDDGHAVAVLDNCSTGHEDNVGHLRSREGFRFLGGDIMNESLVGAAMTDVDVVYHLAAAVGVPHILADPLWAVVTNTRGTEHVLHRAEKNGARVVFASTSEIYGQSDEVPYREDGPRLLGPTWTHRWAYSTAKAVDEHLCFAYRERGMEVSVVRYFNVYGRRMDPAGYGSVIARFMTQALAGEPLTVYGDGMQTRTFTHVSDAVDATVRAGTLEPALGEAFNVGGRTEYRIADLAAMVRDVTGSSSDIVRVPYEDAYAPGFADTRRRVPDVSKAREVLGWEPGIRLEDGLADLVTERVAT